MSTTTTLKLPHYSVYRSDDCATKSVPAIHYRHASGPLVVTKDCGRANQCMNGCGDSENKVAAEMDFFQGHDDFGVGMRLGASMRRLLATVRVTAEG